jgi:hypothetical protein
VLLECAIVLHDNTPPSLSAAPANFKILLERDRRLSHSLETMLHERIRQGCEGLDQAIISLWSTYQAGTEWRHCPSPDDRWLSSKTTGGPGEASRHVNLNILEGRLLVNGKPLGRLPQEIVKHPTYARIFGNVCRLSIAESQLLIPLFFRRYLMSYPQAFLALSLRVEPPSMATRYLLFNFL